MSDEQETMHTDRPAESKLADLKARVEKLEIQVRDHGDKFRKRLASEKVRIIAGTTTVLLTLVAFCYPVYKIICCQLRWLEVVGLLGMALLWLVLATVFLLSMKPRRR